MLDAKLLPKVGKVECPKSKACFVAGFCVCGRTNAKLRKFVQLLATGLRKEALQPDTLSRRLYDVGALVLRLTSTEQEVHWYHLAYGNLNTSHFTVIELYATSQPSLRSRLAEALGLQVCEVDIDNLSFLNLWQIAKTLDMGQHWKLDLCHLYRSTRFVGDTVRPGLVAIQCLHSQVGVQLWSDSESGRKRKRPCSDALDDGDQFDDDDDDERKSDGEEEWMPLADLGDEGAGGDAGGEGDAEEDNLWEPEDD